MRFEVRALKPGGGVVSEALDAPDQAAALQMAAAKGLQVLSARRAPGLRLPGSTSSRFDVVAFSQELVALLGAGLSLPETLELMVEKDGRSESRQLVQRLREQLFEGRSFSQAVEMQGEPFSPLYVATLRAAERSGDLAEALGRYIDYALRLQAVRKKIVSASIYPAALLGVGGLVVLFLLGYVVPRFAGIYGESGRELPWLSRLLIEWGALINGHGLELLLALAIAAALSTLWLRGLRLLAGRALLALPGVSERVRVYHLARLYRTLGMLLRGGTPLVAALGMVQGLLPLALQPALQQATQRIREGSPASQALAQAGLGTPVALRMLQVGENSGELARMMDRIATYHDDELARWIDWFTKLFEPLLMALIGVVIGGIVILMYLPIFDLAGSLG
jgi:general secretion pathway protein F